MYFTEEKNPKFYKRTKLFALLDDFSKSGIRVAKLEDWHYVNAESGRNALARAIKHFKFYGLTIKISNGEIYLINENVNEEREHNGLQ